MATCCDSSYLEQHEHTTLYHAEIGIGNREDEDRHTLDTSTPNSMATSALEHHTARSTSSILTQRMNVERRIASYKRLAHEMRAVTKAMQNVSKIAPTMHWGRRMCRARLCVCWW